jgi:hypothetical protein
VDAGRLAVVVNQTFARAYLGGRDPIGLRIVLRLHGMNLAASGPANVQ